MGDEGASSRGTDRLQRYRYGQDGTKAHWGCRGSSGCALVSISCCAINFAKLVLEPLAILFCQTRLRPPFDEPPPISLCGPWGVP
ncbi:hypothetical protein V8C35DRAFT_286680, partial [Trichoderma chlorosporum]